MNNREKQSYLQEELRAYEKKKEMTAAELSELYKWIEQGNSVYSNPGMITHDDGSEMDFIDGLRIETIIAREISSLSSEQLLEYHRQQEKCMSDLLSVMTMRCAV